MIPSSVAIELRDYQATDIEKIKDAYRRGVRRVLYVLPTGGGKTVEFCEMARGAAAKKTYTSILVHRQELLRQSSRSLERNGVLHGMVAPRYTPNKQFVQIASVQTLVRRLKNSLPFRFIIVDEAHHSLAGSWKKIFEAYPNALILGVTATPCRTNGDGLGEIFQEMILGPSIAELMDEGYLCRARVFSPPTQFTLDGIKKRGGDYMKEELVKALDKPAIIGDTVEHYSRLCPGQPAIDFCCSIKHAAHSAERFIRAGFKWRVLDGEMDDDYREETIEMLGDGRIHGISSCDIISEGTDIPVVVAALLQRPTKSESLYLQQCGRALRPIYASGFDLKTREGRLAAIAASNKPYAIILDHVANTFRHGLPDADRVWSLQGGKSKPSEKARYEEENKISIRQCPKCYNAHKPAQKCPHCGHIYIAEGRILRQIDGSLIEQKREHLETLMAKYKTLAEFKRMAKQNGYDEKWANISFAKQNEAIANTKKDITEINDPIVVSRSDIIVKSKPEPAQLSMAAMLEAQQIDQTPEERYGQTVPFSIPGRMYEARK